MNLDTIQQRVLEIFKKYHPQGLTDPELLAYYKQYYPGEIDEGSPRKRRGELVKKGYIINSGLKRNGATVWVLASSSIKKEGSLFDGV